MFASQLQIHFVSYASSVVLSCKCDEAEMISFKAIMMLFIAKRTPTCRYGERLPELSYFCHGVMVYRSPLGELQ
jgi:hypothetical protein